MSELILPHGYVEKKAVPEGQGKIVGLSPWKDTYIHGRGVNGAAKKKGRWKDYYDMYKGHAILYAAINKIAKTATNVGFDFVPRDSRANPKSRELKTLKDFFSNQADFIGELRKIYKDMLIYGDAYLYVVPDRARRPYRLKRLAPKTMHVHMNNHGRVIAYYQKDVENAGDSIVTYQAHEILHFKLDDPDSDIYGMSPLEALRGAVTADLFAQAYNSSFFQNAGVTGTIIGVRNANPDEVQRNRKWLEENYIGPSAAHKPIIIEGESISIEKSVATHTEMAFLDGRKFIILEILAVLDVPPAKIGIMESANRSNSKEQDKTFRTESISPLQFIVESVINDHFIRPILGVEHTIFVHAEGDTRDAIEQMDYYTKGEAWGIFNPNEVRAKLGMAPVEGGDINGIMAPTGFVPLDRLYAFFEPMQIPKNAIDSKEDPLSGEAPPKRTASTNIGTGSNVRTAKSYNPHDLHKAVNTLLMTQPDDDVSLRKVYTYLNDAYGWSGDPRIAEAYNEVQSALITKDVLLKQGYVERAIDALSDFRISRAEIRLEDRFFTKEQAEDTTDYQDDLEEDYRP
jgi:HK97 family phage portal protein